MTTSKKHYEQVLSPVYSWMYGGFQAQLEKNLKFFRKYSLSPTRSKIAVDLGAGCGFQSIPLAQLGYDVTSIDLDRSLLSELSAHAGEFPVETIEDDLLRFRKHVGENIELAVCMTDTLLHLESLDDARTLISEVLSALGDGGKFVLTFRDLTRELAELDRFIPVRSDANIVFTCFLEYEPETVKVHDLVYRRENDDWKFSKSFYRKLRISEEWLTDELFGAGFATVDTRVEMGLVTAVATKI